MQDETIHQEQADTQHQPHQDAKRRVLVSVGVVVVLVTGLLVWSIWGDDIIETCFGEEVCMVEMPETQ